MDDKLSKQELLEKITRLEKESYKLKKNEARLESLLKLSQLSDTTEEKIREYALESIVSITGSQGGYIHFFNEDNNTIDLVSWSKSVLETCSAEQTKHYPIDCAGLWADSIRFKKPVVHNDFQNLPNKKGYPDGHFKVIRHLSVPIFDQGKIVAVGGVGNKKNKYNDSDQKQTMLFLNNMWSILQQKKAEAILKRYSIEDSLTKIANRRRFDEVIDIEWNRLLRSKNKLSVILFDVDFFKLYNDTYGHLQGDFCLKMVSTCIKDQIRRAGELVARYGGEEIAIILPCSDFRSAFKIANSICQKVHDLKIPHSKSSVSDYVTVSAGVATVIPHRDINYLYLLKSVDEELYTAKERGRNQVYGHEL